MPNYMEEAFAPATAQYAYEVQKDTWGHLALKRNRKYHGHMIFSHVGYGGHLAIIYSEWNGLEDSPWLYNAMEEFAFGLSGSTDDVVQGAVYRFDGMVRNYKFVGTRSVLYMPKGIA